MNIKWEDQHCGVHQAPFSKVKELMPDLVPIFADFPDDPNIFTWDIKVVMLMPNQYPCIPGWHTDNVPRVNGIQRFDLVNPDLPMYCWISGPPLTQFKHGFLTTKKWHRFNQIDEHRGTMSGDFTWRCFIRGTHKDIMPAKASGWQRRHCQVYLDAATFQW